MSERHRIRNWSYFFHQVERVLSLMSFHRSYYLRSVTVNTTLFFIAILDIEVLKHGHLDWIRAIDCFDFLLELQHILFVQEVLAHSSHHMMPFSKRIDKFALSPYNLFGSCYLVKVHHCPNRCSIENFLLKDKISK